MANKDIQLGLQPIQISRLHLDPENPRHEPLSSQAEIIAQLCKEEKILEMVKDIAERGALSPLDVLGVFQDGNPGHYIAVEGNRRVCALILLNDPARAPKELRSQIEKIAKESNVPRQLTAHVFQNREEAKQWVDLRHLGDQGGIGTREWGPGAKARAAGGNTKTTARDNSLALAVRDRLVAMNLLTPEQSKAISLTTITRYLGTPEVRELLGLSGDRNKLIYTHEPSQVDSALRRLLLDSLKTESNREPAVHSRSSSEQRKQYARTLKSEGGTPTTPLAEPFEPSALATPPKPVTGKRRSSKNPAKRPTLIESSFTVKIKDPVLVRLRTEALRLELENFPFSGNYLLRALIEQIMILFAKSKGRYSPSMSDAALTCACSDELHKAGITGKALKTIQKAAGSKDQPFSLHTLGHAVHGGAVPTRKDLVAHFDTWEPVLRAMLDDLENA